MKFENQVSNEGEIYAAKASILCYFNMKPKVYGKEFGDLDPDKLVNKNFQRGKNQNFPEFSDTMRRHISLF